MRCGALCNEKNVSAEQSQEKEETRFPCADEVPGRAPHPQAAAGEGPQAARRLTRAPRRTFPSAARIKKRREFQEVYRRGLRIPGSRLVLFVRPGRAGLARLGITATRRVGGAVVRNRVRRLVREAFRRHRHRMEPWDLVVNIRPGAGRADFRAIESELLSLLKRAKRRARPGAG